MIGTVNMMLSGACHRQKTTISITIGAVFDVNKNRQSQ